MIWKTKLTEILETRYPIIMGAFAVIGKAEFAAAFSNAGGFGIITALNFNTSEEFREELIKPHPAPAKGHGKDIHLFPKAGFQVQHALFSPVYLSLLARRGFITNNDFGEMLRSVFSHPLLN